MGWPPRTIERIRRARRARRAAEELPDALAIMIGAISAGLTIVQAMEVASSELDGPLAEGLARAVRRLGLGDAFDEAVEGLREELPCEDVELFARAVVMLRRSGGNMAECFARMSEAVERRRRVERRITSLTAQGVVQAITLLALPWFMMLMLHVLAPDFISPLFDTRLGNFIIAAAVALELAGALWLRKIVVIRV